MQNRYLLRYDQETTEAKVDSGIPMEVRNILPDDNSRMKNPFTKDLMDAANRAGFVGRDASRDIELLREYRLVLGQKNDLDEIGEENHTPKQKEDYEIIMAKIRAHSVLRAAVDTEIAKLTKIEAVEQKKLPDSPQGGFATQKKVTPWIANLFDGDPRYKVLGGGATSDHVFLDIGLFDTKTRTVSSPSTPNSTFLKDFLLQVQLALSDPRDGALPSETSDDYQHRRNNCFIKTYQCAEEMVALLWRKLRLKREMLCLNV